MRTADSVPEAGLSILLRFRWGAAAACAAMGFSGVSAGFESGARSVFIMGALVLALSNLAALWALRGPDSRLRAGLLVILDAIVLTVILASTGGASNPFAMLYLVLIALTAALLGPRWCWGMALFSTLLYAFLFSLSGGHHDGVDMLRTHLEGMWLAFALSAALVAGFSSRLAALSEQQASELRIAEEGQKKAERLASLSSFAMDTVHELSTPLTTLAVIVGEMERDASMGKTPKISDMRLLRDEVARCGGILDALSGRSRGLGINTSAAPLHVLVSGCVERLTPERRQRVAVRVSTDAMVEAGHEAIERAVTNLLANALDAAPDTQVTLRSLEDPSGVSVLIEDDGPGMDERTLRRAGEPFFTTKGKDRGLGLGIFSARSLVAQIGGTIELRPRAEGGVEARLWFPVAT